MIAFEIDFQSHVEKLGAMVILETVSAGNTPDTSCMFVYSNHQSSFKTAMAGNTLDWLFQTPQYFTKRSQILSRL